MNMKYRDKLYHFYSSTHAACLYGEPNIGAIERQFPVWKKYYGRFLPPGRAADIIDLGCGDGGFVHFLKSMGFENSIGIDISRERVEAALKLGIKGVMHADLREFLSGKQRAYDAVFARDVIEHFAKEEVIEVFEAVRDALKPDGLFVIQTPNGESPLSGRLRYGDFTHEVIFTRTSLNQTLRAAGFGETGFYPAGPVPKGIKSAVRYVLWKAIEALLRFYNAVEMGGFSGIYTQNLIAAAKK